jgi:hypothetical protein
MAHGIHTWMDPVQSFPVEPVFDCAPTCAGGDQLPTSDDSVLARCELGDRRVQRS